MIAVAIVVGFGLSYYALGDGRLFGALRVGPWLAWPAIGATAPDPYTRAYLARSGVLPLGQGEGVTFTAGSDSEAWSIRSRPAIRSERSVMVSMAGFCTLPPAIARVARRARHAKGPRLRTGLRQIRFVG